MFLSPQVQFDFKDKLLLMEASRNRIRGGLWNNPGPRQYSKDTQDMLMCELVAFLSHKGDECVFGVVVKTVFYVVLILYPGFQWWCRNPGLPTCRKDGSLTASKVGLRGCGMHYYTILRTLETYSFLHFPQKEHPYHWLLTPPCLLPHVNLKLSRSACQPGLRDAVPRLVGLGTVMPEKSSVLVPQVGF